MDRLFHLPLSSVQPSLSSPETGGPQNTCCVRREGQRAINHQGKQSPSHYSGATGKSTDTHHLLPELVACLLSLMTAFLTPTASAQPNIVFIYVDDMNAGEDDYMPKYQELIVQQGTKYTKAYTVSPICCPARTSLLRGQYVHNHGVLGNGGNDGGFRAFHDLGLESGTIAIWLQELGYRTGLVGKYLNNYGNVTGFENYVPPGWSEWYALVRQAYYGFSLVENGVRVSYGDKDYQTDVLGDKSVAFINQYDSDPRPFFLYVAPSAPHWPATPARRHKGAFEGITAPRPPSFNEEDVSDKPSYIQEYPLLSPLDEQVIDSEYANRLEALLAVDEALEEIVNALTAIGQLENTYIFFSSDNGWQQGEHRLVETKGLPYEESILMPMAIRGPGVPAGAVRSEFVLNIDFAPTWVEMAGGTPASWIDGRSLLPVMGGSAATDWRKRFLVELLDSQARVPQFYALRSLKDMYADYFELGEKEAYDMRTDPYQLENNYYNMTTNRQGQLSQDLSSLISCAGSSCRTAEK